MGRAAGTKKRTSRKAKAVRSAASVAAELAKRSRTRYALSDEVRALIEQCFEQNLKHGADIRLIDAYRMAVEEYGFTQTKESFRTSAMRIMKASTWPRPNRGMV